MISLPALAFPCGATRVCTTRSPVVRYVQLITIELSTSTEAASKSLENFEGPHRQPDWYLWMRQISSSSNPYLQVPSPLEARFPNQENSDCPADR
ncbi:hypothetical protein K503DRAFT_806195 [Rhizopogon vinicolor AM-OR11-026]|uniref:Uncharacterized protein n=1 Tax=Rhizopogon vinicolor AM-OR11-026 TaxID=1314800 RepID=A0A1B7MFB3_9AGAM|nr:hypothetical protein K503DRAFT_806195 [Rhizopogon vinicolor AM-OR11-026]